MKNKETKCDVSLFGCFLHFFELKYCRNIRNFIARNEVTIQVIFTIIYITLQIMLISNNFISVSLFITLFLGFLTLERITIYIKREYDKEVKSEVTKDISDVKEMNIRIRRQRDFWRNKYFLVSNAIKDKKIKVN